MPLRLLGGRRDAREAVGSPLRFAAAAGAGLTAAAHVLALVRPPAPGTAQTVLSVLVAQTWALLAWLLLGNDTPEVWTTVRRLAPLPAAVAALPPLLAAAGGDAGGAPAATLPSLPAVAAVTALGTGVCAWWAGAAARRSGTRPGGPAPVEAYLSRGARAHRVGLVVLLLGTTVLAATATRSAAVDRHGPPVRPAPSRNLVDALDVPPGIPGGTSDGPASAGPGGWTAVDPADAYHPTGVVRRYYLAAEESVWDYAPLRRNGITGAPLAGSEDGSVASGPGRIGSRYLKCLYRPYADASFTRPSPRPAREAYLGVWGPVLHAAVGDRITVTLRNSCRIPVGVHPHSVFFQAAAAGVLPADNTAGSEPGPSGVAPGHDHTYTWLVPDVAGPGRYDGSSVMWMYNSHADEVGDTDAGLMGPMVITAAGRARADGGPDGVDREVFEVYSVADENRSPYLAQNVRRFAASPPPRRGDLGFVRSNVKHTVNGYTYGDQPLITLAQGQRVRWYLMSIGSDVALHGARWQGHAAATSAVRMDVVGRRPVSMVVANMRATVPGTWLFHCHVNDHLTGGMIARYQVTPSR